MFVVPVKGGRPKRLTFDSADDHPTGWSPDSQNILFMSGRETDLPIRVELFSIPLQSAASPAASVPGKGATGPCSPKRDRIAYVRRAGPLVSQEATTAQSNDDIWISTAMTCSNGRQIAAPQGARQLPDVVRRCGKTLYYVSDVLGGLANLVKQEASGKGTPTALTHHKDDSVRRARISADGESIVYECGADICIYSFKDGKSRNLNIEVNADDKADAETVKTFTTGASEFAWSPDEKHIAFVVHGEIFLMSRAGGKAKRLTDHPAFDHGLAWSPDGKKLLFLSDRNGHEDIFSLEADDPDHPNIIAAHKYKVKQLTDTPEAEGGLSFSPEGNRVGFLRAGKLVTMDPDGKNEKVLVADRQSV